MQGIEHNKIIIVITIIMIIMYMYYHHISSRCSCSLTVVMVITITVICSGSMRRREQQHYRHQHQGQCHRQRCHPPSASMSRSGLSSNLSSTSWRLATVCFKKGCCDKLLNQGRGHSAQHARDRHCPPRSRQHESKASIPASPHLSLPCTEYF